MITLDYASRGVRRFPVQFALSTGILAVCWVVYSVMCVPAMGQRGYPPLESHLQGMTVLWVAGIPLSALVQKFSRARIWLLLGYALATGFTDAASWPIMVPNCFDASLVLVNTAIIFAPLHAAITVVLEAMCRLLGMGARRIGGGKLNRVTTRIMGAAAVLAVTVFLPAGYASYDHWSLMRKGRAMADRDWKEQRAVVILRQEPFFEPAGSILVELHVDEGTGLMLRHDFRNGYEAAYNQRVAELIREHGKPAWGEPRLPTPEELAKLLGAEGFTEVKKFPHRVSPNITINAGGSVEAGSGSYGYGGTPGGTFVREDAGYAGLHFIRLGQEYLEVFDEEGKFVASAWKQ